MSTALIAIGLGLMLFGTLGVIILPDLFLRLHASTKCGVTGTTSFLLGLMLRAGSPGMRPRLLLILAFVLFTAPLIPHVLAVAYLKSRDSNRIES